MSPEMYFAAAAMILAAVAMIVVFRQRLSVASTRRRHRMMTRVGVDDRSIDAQSGLSDLVRRRCERCPADALCERWLAGEIEGDNGFCPNARTFDRLRLA